MSLSPTAIGGGRTLADTQGCFLWEGVMDREFRRRGVLLGVDAAVRKKSVGWLWAMTIYYRCYIPYCHNPQLVGVWGVFFGRGRKVLTLRGGLRCSWAFGRTP